MDGVTTGFILVDPSGFTADQKADLEAKSTTTGGWLHPDGVRWVLPVTAPTTTREIWVRAGWPSDAVVIAR